MRQREGQQLLAQGLPRRIRCRLGGGPVGFGEFADGNTGSFTQCRIDSIEVVGDVLTFYRCRASSANPVRQAQSCPGEFLEYLSVSAFATRGSTVRR